MIAILDTNFLIKYFIGSKDLGIEARRLFEDETVFLIVPSISLFEIKYSVQKGKFPESILNSALELIKQGNCMLYSLEQSLLDYLPKELNIHDGIIYATAAIQKKSFDETIYLLTKDKEIKDLKQDCVKVVW